MSKNTHSAAQSSGITSKSKQGLPRPIPKQTQGALDDDSSVPDFSTAAEELMDETCRLDYGMRYVGSGGLSMIYGNTLRTVLRKLLKLFAQPTGDPKTRENIVQALEELRFSSEKLQDAIRDFMGVTDNRDLISSLNKLNEDLGKTLRKCEEQPDFSFDTAQLKLTGSLISVKSNLGKFVDKDLSTIKSVQKEEAESYTNLTVIATFLSGVTVSMLQIVSPATSGNSALAVIVNISLFSSLIFSTASAMQSLLSIMWMKSFVRPSERSLHHVMYAWLRRGPIISLLAAGTLFALGLVLYGWSSNQHLITPIITTCFAALQTIGLLSLIVLFIRERWKFRRDGGKTGMKLTKSSILFDAMEWTRKLQMRRPSESKESKLEAGMNNDDLTLKPNLAKADEVVTTYPEQPRYTNLARIARNSAENIIRSEIAYANSSVLTASPTIPYVPPSIPHLRDNYFRTTTTIGGWRGDGYTDDFSRAGAIMPGLVMPEPDREMGRFSRRRSAGDLELELDLGNPNNNKPAEVNASRIPGPTVPSTNVHRREDELSSNYAQELGAGYLPGEAQPERNMGTHGPGSSRGGGKSRGRKKARR